MNDFNLSSKIRVGTFLPRNQIECFSKDDVKEFIRLLKELPFAISHEDIDKLAGEELK